MGWEWISRLIGKEEVVKELSPEWRELLFRNLPFYSRLRPELKALFEERLLTFIREKRFIGAAGLEVTDEMKVTIGGLAVRLILGLDLSYYARLTEIIIYPHDFLEPESGEPLVGQLHEWIVVVLSWPAIEDWLEYPGEAVNVVTHEFAHVMDRIAAQREGTAGLRNRSEAEKWSRVMGRHFAKLQKGRGPQAEVLDDYGAENEAEFFAVATEAFFERPGELRERTPDLYRELCRFYQLDPLLEGLHDAESVTL